MKYLSASATTLSVIQMLSVLASVIGLWWYDITLINFLLMLVGYFLYSGCGVSIMMHRYWSHRSFEFKHHILKKVFTYLSILSGRGSPLGWVYVHRIHHAFSDTTKDPHDPNTIGWKILFPHLVKYGESIDKKIIKDLYNREHLNINKYYSLYIICWSVFLLIIDIELFLFFYAIPLMLTFIGLSLFVMLTHMYGYENFKTRDNSKNNWFISLILWGEGWHNNHHHDPSRYTTKIKWWEIDLLGTVIRLIKK